MRRERGCPSRAASARAGGTRRSPAVPSALQARCTRCSTMLRRLPACALATGRCVALASPPACLPSHPGFPACLRLLACPPGFAADGLAAAATACLAAWRLAFRRRPLRGPPAVAPACRFLCRAAGWIRRASHAPLARSLPLRLRAARRWRRRFAPVPAARALRHRLPLAARLLTPPTRLGRFSGCLPAARPPAVPPRGGATRAGHLPPRVVRPAARRANPWALPPAA